MPAPAVIPFAANDPSGFTIPKGLTQTTTPQGGTAYSDQGGNTYIKGTNGFTLAPQTLPSSNYQPPTAGQGNNPVPNAAPAADVQVQPVAPTMHPAVKTGIETAANAETNSLGSGVPTTTAPSAVDYSLHNGETIDQYNARVKSEQDAQGTTGTNTASTSSTPNINDFMGAVPAQPTPPDLNADQTAESNAVGIPAIQTNINTLTTQLQQAQSQALLAESSEASKPGVVSTIINGRIAMISGEDAVAIKNLQDQINTAQSQLTAANAAVATFMKNDQTNYQDASDAYEKAYTSAVTQYNDAVTQEEKQQSSAKANAQVIINSYKGSTEGANAITDEDKASWTALELQAGLPPGTISAAVQAELNVTKFVKGTDGNEYVIGTDDTGAPYTAQIGTVGGKSTGGTPNEQQAQKVSADLATMSGKISTVIDQNKSGGAKDTKLSPEQWSQALQIWQSQGPGHDVATFVSNYKGYANTADPANDGQYEGLN